MTEPMEIEAPPTDEPREERKPARERASAEPDREASDGELPF